MKEVVDPLENNFLKECGIISIFWEGKVEMEDSLSDNRDDVVQTTRKYGKKVLRSVIRRNDY